MAIFVVLKNKQTDLWVELLKRYLPNLRVCRVDELSEPKDYSQVEYALIDNDQSESIPRFSHLKYLFSSNAGIEKALNDSNIAPTLPIVRLIDDNLTAAICEWVCGQVLAIHRNFYHYQKQQQRQIWQKLPQISADKRQIGIVGLGVLGGSCAQMLTRFGFRVTGWSRQRKKIPQVKCFAGMSELPLMLAQSDIVVTLLPATGETNGLFNKNILAKMKPDSYIINAGRGQLINDSDLIKHIDSGRIAGAILDVFNEEPLPNEHPYWRHPKIILTPHVAGITDPNSAVLAITENINRIDRGLQPVGLVSRHREY